MILLKKIRLATVSILPILTNFPFFQNCVKARLTSLLFSNFDKFCNFSDQPKNEPLTFLQNGKTNLFSVYLQ